MPKANSTKLVNFRVGDDLKAVVKADAKNRGTTLSEVLRSAVVEDQTRRGNWPPKESK